MKLFFYILSILGILAIIYYFVFVGGPFSGNNQTLETNQQSNFGYQSFNPLNTSSNKLSIIDTFGNFIDKLLGNENNNSGSGTGNGGNGTWNGSLDGQNGGAGGGNGNETFGGGTGNGGSGTGGEGFGGGTGSGSGGFGTGSGTGGSGTGGEGFGGGTGSGSGNIGSGNGTGGSGITGNGTGTGNWNTNPGGTVCITAEGLTTGTFTIQTNTLTSGTLYHYRGYATNATGTGYTEDATFTTLGTSSSNTTITDATNPPDDMLPSSGSLPVLDSPTATNITETNATLGATLVSLGIPASISARGVCYGLLSNPSLKEYLPDLVAESPAPTIAFVDQPTTFYSTIKNMGGSSTVDEFNYFFQIDTGSDDQTLNIGVYNGVTAYGETGTYAGSGSYGGVGSYSGSGSYTGSGSYSGSGSYTGSGSYGGSGSYSGSGTFGSGGTYGGNGTTYGGGETYGGTGGSGGTGTTSVFGNFFQSIASGFHSVINWIVGIFSGTASGASTIIIDLPSSSMPALGYRQYRDGTMSYTFTSLGTYRIRACADKSSSTDTGNIYEWYENNNCSSWRTIKVVSPQCSDNIDNDGNDDIDELDPDCHVEGDINNEYVPTHNSEAFPPEVINNDTICIAASGLTTGAFTIQTQTLKPNTLYHYRGYATNATGTGYTLDATFTTTIPSTLNTPAGSPPTLTTNLPVVAYPNATNITQVSATLGASVTSLGIPPVISARGVCYGTSTDIILEDYLPDLTTGAPSPYAVTVNKETTFAATILNKGNSSTGKNFNYFFQLDLGEEPASVPTVTSQNANVDGTSVKLSASLTSLGIPASVSEMFFYYGASDNTVNNMEKVAGTLTISSTSGLGVFQANLSKLNPGAYSFRGCATNSTGTGCSDYGTFTISQGMTTTPTGTLSVSNCIIPVGNNTCKSTLNWNISNPISSVETAITTPIKITVPDTSKTSGTTTYAVSTGPGTRDFFLYHNGVQLGSTQTATASCISGANWNGSICEKNAVDKTNVPTVKNQKSTVKETSVTLSADLADSGIPPDVSEVFFYYESADSTINNPQKIIGTMLSDTVANLGTFSATINKLTSGNYSFRGCATNSTGTGCSDYGTFNVGSDLTTSHTATISASPTTIKSGGSIKLTWSSSPTASSCIIGHDKINSTEGGSGTIAISNITTTTTFTISCVWSDGMKGTTGSTTVTVGDDLSIGDVKGDGVGDVNGDGLINCTDVTMIKQAFAGIITLTADQQIRADVNGNGYVNGTDASALSLKYNLSCSDLIDGVPSASIKDKFINFLLKISKKVALAATDTSSSTTSVSTTSGIIDLPASLMTTLGAGKSGQATVKYTFPNLGEYRMRACADKSSSTDTGTVTEGNENNNCGPWTIITVSDSSIPPAVKQCSDTIDNDLDGKIDADDPECHVNGDLTEEYLPNYDDESKISTECSDTIDNDDDNEIDADDPECHVNGNLSEEYLPNYDDESTVSTECNDTIDNDGNDDIDAEDPECHYGGLVENEYVPTNDSEDIAPVEPEDPNKCLLIEENPLTFTVEEQARLAVLLRKFYLIAQTLKTTEDITTIYSEIEQYKDLIKNVDDLTKQCYLETNDTTGFTSFCNRNPKLCNNNDKFNSTYSSQGNKKHGNPWFTPSGQTGGTFPYTNEDNGYWSFNLLNSDVTGLPISYDIIGAVTNSQITTCKAVDGYYYGTDNSGKNCEDYNVEKGFVYDCWSIKHLDITGWSSTDSGDPDKHNVRIYPEKSLIEKGCKWHYGFYAGEAERILNIW